MARCDRESDPSHRSCESVRQIGAALIDRNSLGDGFNGKHKPRQPSVEPWRCRPGAAAHQSLISRLTARAPLKRDGIRHQILVREWPGKFALWFKKPCLGLIQPCRALRAQQFAPASGRLQCRWGELAPIARSLPRARQHWKRNRSDRVQLSPGRARRARTRH